MINQRVSVIIPCYNSKEYIEDTLNSVYNQSYDNVEIIIIDDGSSDGSFEYLTSLENPNLIVKKNIEKGACAARNYGFELATGEYIQFLDADDILSPKKIEAQVKLAKTYGKANVYSCQWFHFKDTIDKAIIKKQIIDKDYNKPYKWLNDSWHGKGMGQTAVWLAHRDIIEHAGRWNENLSINQDGEFFCRVLLNANSIKFSDIGNVFYRIGNQKSISSNDVLGQNKAASLLLSYKLYIESTKAKEVFTEVKKGLANNLLDFIYRYYNVHKELVEEAQKMFYELGYKKMWPVGGENFKRFANILGFKRTLRLRSLIKNK